MSTNVLGIDFATREGSGLATASPHHLTPWTPMVLASHKDVDHDQRQAGTESAMDERLTALYHQSIESPLLALSGTVRRVRKQKKHVFLSVGQGLESCLDVVIDRSHILEHASLEDRITELREGTGVRFVGEVQQAPATSKHEQEFLVKDFEVLAPVDSMTYPVQKKHVSPVATRDRPHARNYGPDQAVILMARSHLITRFASALRGAVQVHTPIITSSDCEGAGENFPIIAKRTLEESGKDGDFFDRPAYLTVSSQLHLESFLCRVGDVWTLSPAFRAETSQTSRHLSEFYMLEAEFAWCDLQSLIARLRDVLIGIISEMDKYISQSRRYLSQNCIGIPLPHSVIAKDQANDAAPDEEAAPRFPTDPCTKPVALGTPWQSVTYTRMIQELRKSGITFQKEPRWETGLSSEHERWIVDVWNRGHPIFVTHYPAHLKAFYMRKSSSKADREAGALGPTVANFDLLFPGVGELVGGSMREHRYPELVRQMRWKGMLGPTSKARIQAFVQEQTYPLWSAELEDAAMSEATGFDHPELALDESFSNLEWYAEMRKWGCMPHGGWGLGFDRLLAYLLRIDNVKDVVPFPRWAGNCQC